MAKQCIYCGHLLAKEDARFCNDCGQSQVPSSGVSAVASEAAPTAIKVKLPPREFSRADSSPIRPETSFPGRGTPTTPSLSEQVAPPPSSRMPKRPARLTPSGSPAPVDKTVKKAEPTEDALSTVVRLTGSASTPAPASAEEISTMVLPNWREELALLRKEQEQAGKGLSVLPEQKIERPATPPPLPRRPMSVPLTPRETNDVQSPAFPSPWTDKPSDLASGVRAPQEKAPPVESPQRATKAALPQEKIPPVESPQRAPGVSLPAPEKPGLAAERAPRELRVKVWEQQTVTHSPRTPEENEDQGPDSAIEQNPLMNLAFAAEEQGLVIEEQETVQWQTPLSPIPTSPSRPPAKGEKHPLQKEEPHSLAKEESQPLKEGSPLSAEVKAPLREDLPAPVEVKTPPKEANESPALEQEDDIEDLPTVPLAVPEAARSASQIKIERASTPAPKKWTVPPTGEVEDLPTRPMAASPAVSPISRMPQPPDQPPSQGEESHPEPGQTETLAPSGPKPEKPTSLPGTYGSPLSAQPVAQAKGMTAEPLVSRGRPGNPYSQPGVTFDPASLPPLPAGPIPASGNAPARPSTPYPDAVGQRPPQRPPSFEPAVQSKSVDTLKPASDVVEGKKPRKKGRARGVLLVMCLLLVLIAGSVGAYVYYQSTAGQGTQPYWTYRDSKLGIAIDYTAQWQINLDPTHNLVRFIDNKINTDRATLTVTAPSGQIGDYLNQQAAQSVITASKPASPVTFAGTSWQVVQGTVTQSGATYTVVLYATQHNNHFYLLEFQAPQISFESVDQSSFAHMRSSFQFL